MDNYTDETKIFLDDRFDQDIDGIYYAHQPIYGYRSRYSSGSDIGRYMLTRSILDTLSNYSFNTFIDIGGAEGYTANLVRKFFNAKVTSTDLSEMACRRAKEIYDIDAVACDIHSLPFPDNSFDVVLCSETIEHVSDYKAAIEELLRIARNVLVITVPHESPEEVAANIRNKVPHGHINYFDTTTLDYLKERLVQLKNERTLSPLLVFPRVIVEARKKDKPGILFNLYNFFIPILNKVFGVKSAVRLSNSDRWFCKTFGSYRGITFTLEKFAPTYSTQKKPRIDTADFIDDKVPYFRLSRK
jgi:Methyltransferase domain